MSVGAEGSRQPLNRYGSTLLCSFSLILRKLILFLVRVPPPSHKNHTRKKLPNPPKNLLVKKNRKLRDFPPPTLLPLLTLVASIHLSIEVAWSLILSGADI